MLLLNKLHHGGMREARVELHHCDMRDAIVEQTTSWWHERGSC